HLHDEDRRLRDNQADRPRMLPSRRASQVLTRRQADRLSHGPQLSPPRRYGDLRDERRWHESVPGHIEPDVGRLARLPILQWRLSGLGATPGGWVATPSTSMALGGRIAQAGEGAAASRASWVKSRRSIEILLLSWRCEQ